MHQRTSDQGLNRGRLRIWHMLACRGQGILKEVFNVLDIEMLILHESMFVFIFLSVVVYCIYCTVCTTPGKNDGITTLAGCSFNCLIL